MSGNDNPRDLGEPVSTEPQDDGSTVLTFEGGQRFRRTIVLNRATERREPHFERLADAQPEQPEE